MIDGTIPARTAAMVRATALQVGVTPWQLADVPGLDPADLGNDLLRVPIESAWRIWELIGSTGGPGAGLRATATAHRGQLGVWDYLFSGRETLAESLRTVMELRSVVTDPAVGWEVIEDGGLLTVRVAVAAESDPVFVPVEEFVLSLMLRRIREATQRYVVPVRVAFTHLATDRHRHLIDEFGTSRIDFGASHSEITFLDVGTLPTGSDPHLGDVLCHYTQLLLASSRSAPDWHDKVRAAISDAITRGELELDGVARRLSISSRTLQRRLHELDTTWRREVEDARRQQALNLLRDTGLPIQSVAARVGYTDARTLRRACHRWIGQTPDAFRREVAGNRAE